MVEFDLRALLNNNVDLLIVVSPNPQFTSLVVLIIPFNLP